MTLTRALIWSALFLTTGWRAPAYCQPIPQTTPAWIEITATNCIQDWNGPWENYPCTLSPGQYDTANLQTHWSSFTRTHDCFFGNPPLLSIRAFDGVVERQLAVPGPTIAQRAAGLVPHYWNFRWEMDYSSEWSSYPCPIATRTGFRRHFFVIFGQYVDGCGWNECPGPEFDTFVMHITESDRGYGEQDMPTGLYDWQQPGQTDVHTIPIHQYTPDGLEPERLQHVLSGDIDGFDLTTLRSVNTVAEIRITGDTMVVWIGSPMAAADWNRDGEVDVPDLMDFLAAWFQGSDRAAACDGVAGCGVPDITAFLSDWFGGE